MTGVDDRVVAVLTLLTEAEAAHGVYETAALGGIFDQDWPRWYAAYAVEHGIGELIGRPVTADGLASFLAATFDEFKGADPPPAEPWPAWTARRIATEL